MRPLAVLRPVALSLLALVAVGCSATASDTTTAQVAASQSPKAQVYAGDATELVFPASGLPAGWTLTKGVETLLAGPSETAIFMGENPVLRAKPIASGVTSVVGRTYLKGTGGDTEGILNDIFVYATDADAQAAMSSFPGVVTSKKASHFAVSTMTAPSYLGSDATAREGTLISETAVTLPLCMTFFRQGNVVSVITAVAGAAIPRETCALAARQAFDFIASKQAA